VKACLYSALELQISLDDLVFSVDLCATKNGVSSILNDTFKDSQQNG
jgi:hypothetical protein